MTKQISSAWLLCLKSGLFGSQWQNSRQVEGFSILSPMLLNLAKQIKTLLFLTKYFLPNKETTVFEVCLSYVQF